MKLMKSLLSLMVLLSTASLAVTPPAAPHGEHARHGFVVVGNRHLYHLARFDSPHRFLGIFGIEVRDGSGNVVDVEAIRRRLPAGTVLSMVSTEHFDLSELGRGPGNFAFQADLIRGYLRDPASTPLLRNLNVTRVAVRHFAEISRQAARPRRPEVVLFCESGDTRFYAAHRIAGGPNFEEITEVSLFQDVAYEDALVGGSREPLRCGPGFQGVVLTAVNQEGDAPIGTSIGLRVNVPQLGVYPLDIQRVLLLDERAVNGTPHRH